MIRSDSLQPPTTGVLTMNFRSSYFPTDEQFFNEQRQQLTREYATNDFSDATPSFGACQQQQQQQLSYLLGSRCSYSCYTQPAFDDREQNSESPLTTSNQSDSPVTTISRETGAPHSCVGNDESRKIYDQIPTASRSTSKVFGDSSEKIKLQKLADGSISSFCIQQIDELYDVKSHQSRQYQQQQQLLSSAIVHSVSDGVSVFDAPMVTTSAISSPSVIASTSVDPVSSFSAASNAANDDFRPVFLDYVTSPMTAVGEQLVATADGISSDLPPTCNRRRYSETEAMTPMTALQQTLPLAQLEAVLGRCSTDCHTSILPSPRLYQRLNHLAPPLTNQQPVRPLLLQTSCSIGNGAYHSATAGVRVKPEMQYDDDNEQGSVDAGCFGISASSIGIDFTQSFTRNGVVTTPSTRCRSNGSSTSFELSSEAEMVNGTSVTSATNNDDVLRRKRRREQNRRAARKCREKKKENVDSMKIAYDKTKAENERLRVERNKLQLLVVRLQDLMRVHQSVCRLSQSDVHPSTMQTLSTTPYEAAAGNAVAAADASDVGSDFTSSVFQFDQLFD